MENNILKVVFGADRTSMENYARSTPLWQYDYGQKLLIEGITLPMAYEVHFSNKRHGDSVTVIGDDTGVDIPDEMLLSGQDVYAWVYLHSTENDGETEYMVTIPVSKRAKPTNETPTPVQQDVITQAIAAMQAAVARSETNVEHYPCIINGYWYVWNAQENAFVNTGVSGHGEKGDDGNGISRIELNPDYTLTFYYTNGTSYTTGNIRGAQGPQGEPGPKGDKGDKGDPGKPMDIIDDTAGAGETERAWSADKLVTELGTKADKTDTVLNTTLSRGRKENTTVGQYSIAFGYDAEASGALSQAIGLYPTASGIASHAEGNSTTASGENSHAEGSQSAAYGVRSHAEGYSTVATGPNSHAEGNGASTAQGAQSAHAEGEWTQANAQAAHAEGMGTRADGYYAHSEGDRTVAAGNYGHAEGSQTAADGTASHAEGYKTTANGNYSHVEGDNTYASGQSSHAEGVRTEAAGLGSHAEGYYSKSTGQYAHTEGARGDIASKMYNGVLYVVGASGARSHAEGLGGIAAGTEAHAEGNGTYAIGDDSHAEGIETKAIGYSSHAEGSYTTAKAMHSHAEGYSTIASGNYSHVSGKHNVEDLNNQYVEIIGNGTGNATRSNARTLDWNGNEHLRGDLYVNCNPDGTGGTKVDPSGGGDVSNKADKTDTVLLTTLSRGRKANTTVGYSSFAFGDNVTASGENSHAEGTGTVASALQAHAEGMCTVANGDNSHVGGTYNVPDSYSDWDEWVGGTSYVVGDRVKRTFTNGNNTSVVGYICKTANDDASFNSSNWTNWASRMNYAEIIGNGVDSNARSNARTLDWEGNERLMGDIYVGCNSDGTGGTNLRRAVDKLTPDATASDVGKAIIVKTVENGKPTAYEYGEAGGGSVDPSAIAQAVDDWCDENITNPDSPPLDRSLTSSSAAAPADITGDLKNAVDDYVVEEIVNNIMQQITPQDLRISASNGATTANGNWKAYVIDIDDIDETLSVKLYSSSTSYANIAYYNSKTTLDSSTNVGTPVTASGSGTYLEASYSDLNIPSTAVCVVFCTNVNGSEAFIHKTIKTPKVYTRSEVDALVEPYKYTPYLMSWHELGGIFKFGMQATGNVGSKIQGSGSNKWNYSYYDISGQSHLKISTAIYGSLIYGVYFTTSDDTIVSRYLLKGSDVAESISNYDLEVPASATKIYVNTYRQERTNPSVKGITTNNDTATALELRLLSFNCGQFDYGDGSTTDEQYKSNWRSLINDTVFDLCALQDYVATFGELQDEAKDVLFGSTIKSFLGTGSNSEDGLRLASRLNAGFLGAIDVGGGSGVWRSTVLKYNVFALEKNIIVYVGHYQPGADYVSARSTQYANVIADAVANGYEYVIFCGDFNAQTISEYQPFIDAGYEICNGGYTGDHVTLRDIYADNIVYTSNLMETHFEVITGHTLNTDHYPILVTFKVKS